MRTTTSTLVLASLGVLGSLVNTQTNSSSSSSASGFNSSYYISNTEENLQTLSCYIYGGLSFYDLTRLQNNVSDYTLSSLAYTYNFNFCRYAQDPCNDGQLAFAFRYKKSWSYDRCTALSDDDYTPDSIKSWDANLTANTSSNLLYTFGGGDECNGADSSISYHVTCNINATGTPIFTLNDTDPCNPIILFTHAAGCPTADLNSFANFISENPWVIALFCIFLGPIINFYGRKFIPWVIGIVSGTAAFVVSLVTFEFIGLLDYFSNTTNEGLAPALISIAMALIIGVAIGYFMMTKFLVIGLCILGGVAGFFLGGIVFNVFMVEWVTSVAALWCTIFFFAAIGACLAYYFRDSIVILSTSFIGSYLFIRGISIIFGGYPSEFELYNEISTGTAEFSTSMIGYLAAMAFFFVLGAFYQHKKKFGEHDNHFRLLKD